MIETHRRVINNAKLATAIPCPRLVEALSRVDAIRDRVPKIEVREAQVQKNCSRVAGYAILSDSPTERILNLTVTGPNSFQVEFRRPGYLPEETWEKLKPIAPNSETRYALASQGGDERLVDMIRSYVAGITAAGAVSRPNTAVEDGGAADEAAAPVYWVFVCNPRKWAIDRFLAERIERDTWSVRPSDRQRFAPGQLALVRVGVDRRTVAERQGRPQLEPGVYALCEVESAAFPGTSAAGGFWAPDEARSDGWPTVEVRYLKTYTERPLTIARLRAERSDLSPHLLNGLQAASFPLDGADFRAVLGMLGEDSPALPGPPAPPPGGLDELADLERRYLHAVPEVRERIGRAVERGPIGTLAKRLNGYRCQVCEALGREPLGFLKPDGEPYVEAHHVVPVALRQVGTLAVGNVVTVCANHHRQLHYGGVGVEVGAEAFGFGLPEGAIQVPRLRVPDPR